MLARRSTGSPKGWGFVPSTRGIAESRNIGHNWRFSEQQKAWLGKYCNTNQLLVDCLKSSTNVVPVVRNEIKETLLLRLSKIKKRRTL